MKRYFKQGALAAGLLAVQLSAPAVDLDLYVNTKSSAQADLPNVLFVIDNTANWNNAFANEMKAIQTSLHNLPANKFNVGIMFATETGTGNGGEKGGYIRAAIRPMTDANKLLYENLVLSFSKLGDKSNGGASGVQMAEAWAYFSGGTPYSGHQKVKTDYFKNTAGTGQDVGVWELPGNALATYSATKYNSPVIPGSCAKNYIIYISNGPNQQNSSADSVANGLLSVAAGGGSAGTSAVAQINLNPSGSQSNPSDEWARFMKKSSLGITTYSIDIDPVGTGQGPGWTALLKSMSGESNYKAVTSGSGGANILGAINDALSKIQSVNSVFAAVSLPASANVQGAYLNQLYVGMFRPDADSKPRWQGNIKQYRRGSTGKLADADGSGAINDQTGFITECARSFWTPAKGSDTYWANDPKGKCLPPGSDPTLYEKSNSPDGNIVEKGAQAYVLRGITPSSRIVKTCSTSDCTELAPFSSTTVSTGALGAADSTERDKLISWAMGSNIDLELSKANTVMRPSAHGDVIHSNPMALNYGSSVVVYYGSNDGMLHAINGNQAANIGTVAPGGELWSFMPPEFFPHLKRLRANTDIIAVTPAGSDAATGTPKPYAVDGPITAYQEDGVAWLFASMRRGGRSVYAFDVSDAAAPSLMWKAGCKSSSDADCAALSTDMGQTWSSPRPIKAEGYFSGDDPLLIMGGGYDECEDKDVNTCTSSSKGHKIFVLDAESGLVQKVLNTDRGVVAEVRIIPDARGFAKYAYAADLGGNVYRIDIGARAPADWTIVKIASLGCDTATTCDSNRKFMFAPSVIPEADGSVTLYIGAGDREKPLAALYFPQTVTVANYFFKIIDRPTDATWLSAESTTNCPGESVICLASLANVGDTDEQTPATCGGTPASGKKGWYLGMRPTEQVVTQAATRFGITTFSTHMPAVSTPGSCASNLGTVHVYNLDIQNGAPAAGTSCSDVVTGGGLPPPPEKMDICMNASCSDKVPVCIGCSTTSPIELGPGDPSGEGNLSNAKRRVYWYIQE